ncbi:hypothetical protein JCM10908_000052 [Rhodotorula pacifica]|uniref:START domain-containing protein n=1 Tax=Rhodotorula pacifica TaxID=1495444 RepID=UPI00317611F4
MQGARGVPAPLSGPVIIKQAPTPASAALYAEVTDTDILANSTNAAYSAALSSALAHFQSLLSNPHSKSWKPVSTPSSSASLAGTVASPGLSSTDAATLNAATAATLSKKGKGRTSSSAATLATAAAAALPGPFVHGLAPLDPSQIRVHRKSDPTRNADIVRAIAEVPCDPDKLDLDAVRAVLSTPEVRPQWDKLVDASTGLSLLDPLTRITKTDYRLGWPASPRDTITISRTFASPAAPGETNGPSSSSLIDLSTSLPRAADEPAFLRPAPPFVRAHTHLMAWCFQVLPPDSGATSSSAAGSGPSSSSAAATPRLSSSPAGSTSFFPPQQPDSAPFAAPVPAPHRLRITLFWQWSLRLAAPLSATTAASSTASSSSLSYASPHTAHIAPLIASLVAYLRMSTPGAGPLPLVRGYGKGVEMNRDEWDLQSETRSVDYAVVALPGVGAREGAQDGEDGVTTTVGGNLQGLDELYRKRERNRLERSIEISLPPLGVQFPPLPPLGGESAPIAGGASASGSGDGWDVRITVKALGGGAASTNATPASTPGLVARDAVLSVTTITTSSSTGAAGSGSSTEIDTSYALSLSAVPLPSSDTSSASPPSAAPTPARLILRVTHPALKSQSHLLRVTITIQRLAGGKRVRVNGEKMEVERIEVRDPMTSGRDLFAAAGIGAASEKSPDEEDARSIDTQASSSETINERRLSADGLSNGGGGENGSSISLSTAAAGGARSTSPSLSSSAQIASLLRRSYIYFLSLLQEPPAKWRHVTDSAGVSVTQLLSPDPTLTIYRAEAVFVGVGVWDAFATVVTPGVRRTWDKNVEGAVLIADEENGAGAGELSEVWWERRKGIWPVSARDSVLLRTAYKSPSSVHIFSSSTDNTTLFPSIPPPAEGTIRIQTDLFGWSIEALSPTTTQITLLDQSDPKGWSSKSSWTPQALVQAVAGVRDYSLKNGAPPVVTRLGGRVRKTSEEYDPDRSTLRVAYAPIVRFTTADAPPTDDIDSQVECEIRCDASTWASGTNGGVEVVVDPPPSNVSCLLRHRLSAGGGLWLTIEHARNVVAEEGRVTITVRKGSSAGPATNQDSKAVSSSAGGGGSSPTVMINGARVKVDVEVLDDDKVRELEKRKRVKAAPVPLDQYETLGPRTGPAAIVRAAAAAAAAVAATASTVAAVTAPSASTAPTTSNEPVQDAAVAGQEKGLSALAKDVPAVASADSSVAEVAAAAVDPAAVGETASAVEADTAVSANAPSPAKPPLDPPACALEALAWLQTFHAEQGPELTDPAPGWTNVNERSGVVVRKKILPRISTTIPVYRGDKIVQGLTADEIASIVTSAGCRKSWDDRIDSATPLASYGHGVTTLALVTKPTFPFRGRFFNVATANAAVKVPSASSGASTSTVLFVASASYTPKTEESFDMTKLNPLSLPTGQVLLEGWILETLDPYTSSVLAIPSTRCTFVSCADQKGSVPLALNTTLNANLAKAMSNVEQFGKTRGPLPRLWAPPLRLQIEGPLSDDSGDDFVWRLEDASPTGQAPPGDGVFADYDAAELAFRTLVRVNANPSGSSEARVDGVSTGSLVNGARKSLGGSGEKGAGKSKPPPLLSPQIPPGSSLLKNELSRTTSLNLVSTAPPVLHKAPIMSELSRKSSHNSLRTAAAAAPTTAPPIGATSATKPSAGSSLSTSTTPSSPADHDVLVAEVVVDLKQYPHGYSLSAKGRTLPAESEAPLSLDSTAGATTSTSSSVKNALEVPLRCVAHDAPLPSILTASLDAWKRANHLVRVLVPTGAITHPIKDPLRDEDASSKVKAPEWYSAFVDAGGALVEIVITALPAPPPPTLERSVKPKDRVRDMTAGVAEVSTTKVTGQANKTVMFNGEKLVVQTQKESKAVLARFEDDDLPLQGAKISRVPPRKRRKSSVVGADEPERQTPELLPPRFQKPLAVATRLLAPKPVTPVAVAFDLADPKSPGADTPADEEAHSPTGSSKLALTPATSRRETITSTTSTPGGPLLSLLSGYPLSRLTTSMLASTVDVTETSPSGVVAVRRTYTLSFVLVVAIISFLIGSLLRSLLTPADYIIYRPESTAGHSDVEHALLSALDVNRRWREARRLLELRGLLGWDLMVAAVKRE